MVTFHTGTISLSCLCYKQSVKKNVIKSVFFRAKPGSERHSVGDFAQDVVEKHMFLSNNDFAHSLG